MILTALDADRERPYEIDNIDPEGAERLPGGLLRARKLKVGEALERYGNESHHPETRK